PYSFSRAEFVGSAMPGSWLACNDDPACHPLNSRGRIDGAWPPSAANAEATNKMARTGLNIFMERQEGEETPSSTLDYRLAGKVSRKEVLLPGAFVHLARDLHAAQTTDILGNAAIQRFCNPLAIFRGAQPVLIAWITNKGDFSQNRGHIGADEHNERRFLHAAIS